LFILRYPQDIFKYLVVSEQCTLSMNLHISLKYQIYDVVKLYRFDQTLSNYDYSRFPNEVQNQNYKIYDYKNPYMITKVLNHNKYVIQDISGSVTTKLYN